MRRSQLILSGLLIALAGVAHGGGFGKLPASARAVTFGGILVAVQDDPNALFSNPAGIGAIPSLSLSTSYTSLYPGISDDNLSFLTGAASFSLGDFGHVGAGIRSFRSDSWKEGEAVGTYAQSFFDLITVGGSAKLLYWSAAAPAGRLAVPEGSLSSTTVSFDAGAQIRVTDILPDNDVIVGLALRDLTSPSIAANRAPEGKIDRSVLAGLNYISRALYYSVAIGYEHAGDVDRFSLSTEILAAHGEFAGQEVGLTVRGGAGRSARPVRQDGLFGGFGIAIAGFQFDYAFGQPVQVDGLGGAHHLTLRATL